jgi:hypothetical protein
MSLIQFPFSRIAYAGIVNPVFVDDIKAANQEINDAITAITGMNSTDFAILSGMEFVPGITNTFNPGWFYFQGQTYYMNASFNEGFYLQPNPTNIMPEGFIDPTATKNIYTVYYAVTSSSPTGNTPIFSGNMNAYRIGLKYFQGVIAGLQTVTTGLGTTAYTNLGTATGQVLTANQTYTQAQVNAILAGYQPSTVGQVINFLPLSSGQNTAFLALFNGSGEGVTYPWIGWHLLNGQDGYPDMTGVMPVGVGTSFVYNTPGGADTVTLIANNIPPLNSDAQFAGAGGISQQAYNQQTAVQSKNPLVINSASPTTPVNIKNKYLPMYFIIRHT